MRMPQYIEHFAVKLHYVGQANQEEPTLGQTQRTFQPAGFTTRRKTAACRSLLYSFTAPLAVTQATSTRARLHAPSRGAVNN